ncbi:hypothetical protein Asi02nite_78990 [Asanoa siamensis]|uniref:Uncharacterized protein n=1 Tax=Asanoa siamensis TaxID=926357 RepID=A0ABQ4D4E1_9ACTN|nr:hypothetical protein Asi02nite_78990 [Asanoa siamensis]
MRGDAGRAAAGVDVTRLRGRRQRGAGSSQDTEEEDGRRGGHQDRRAQTSMVQEAVQRSELRQPRTGLARGGLTADEAIAVKRLVILEPVVPVVHYQQSVRR